MERKELLASFDEGKRLKQPSKNTEENKKEE